VLNFAQLTVQNNHRLASKVLEALNGQFARCHSHWWTQSQLPTCSCRLQATARWQTDRSN